MEWSTPGPLYEQNTMLLMSDSYDRWRSVHYVCPGLAGWDSAVLPRCSDCIGVLFQYEFLQLISIFRGIEGKRRKHHA